MTNKVENKRRLLSFIAISAIIILSLLIFLFISNIDKEPTENPSGLGIDDLGATELTKDEISAEKAKERMDTLKKKMALKGLIAEGDLYIENQQYTVALTKYLQAYKDIPEDQEVNLKLGDIYYNLNKFSKANSYYSKIKTYPNLDKDKAIMSYLNANEVHSGSILELNQEIDSFGIDEQKNFYYKNSAICTYDFSLCRKNFQDYFDKNEENINSGESTETLNNELANIKEAFINYSNFKIDDLTYKAALVAGSLYENGLYFSSLGTSKTILEESSNYKPVLLIAAKSAYELGDYISAKQFLINYKKIESNNAEASYFLGRVYEKLNENILSIIHFNKAIDLGYTNIEDIKRRLIFIYFELEDNEKMLKTFKELIDLNSYTLNLNDYNLAIYYHIINDDLETALEYSEIAKTKFPDSELFYGYYSWIILQEENIEDFQLKVVENNINKGLEINDKNPMIVMVKGMLELKKENYSEALLYFKNTISLDNTGEYEETAKLWLDKIPSEKEKIDKIENNLE